MTGHTPGPWTREPGQRGWKGAGIKGPDGMYVVAALDFNDVDRDDEVEANARLIAAAPDLLAIVEMLGEWVEADADAVSLDALFGDTDCVTLRHAIHTTIAAATGEEVK